MRGTASRTPTGYCARAGCNFGSASASTICRWADSLLVPPKGSRKVEKILKTEPEWKQQLTPEQYEVTRKKGTERAFTGKYWNNHEVGIYRCACCGAALFTSDTKFDSGTGWPSFWSPIAEENVRTETDTSYGMERTEVV